MTRFQMLSDQQWAAIADLLPARTGRRGRPFSDASAMIEGIVYRYRCGTAWRDVPAVFGPWQTILDLASAPGRGRHLGPCPRTSAHRRRCCRDAGLGGVGGLDHRPCASARHEHRPPHRGAPSSYTNPRIEPPDHAVGRSRGGLSTKIHHLVDGHGLPLVVLVAPGQSGDSPAFPHLLDQLRVPRLAGGRPRTHRELLRRRRIGAVIADPSDQAGHRRRRGSRGGRPPVFDSVDYRGRNVVERRFCQLKQWRGLATRYDKLAIVYRAAVMLNAVIAWVRHLSDVL